MPEWPWKRAKFNKQFNHLLWFNKIAYMTAHYLSLNWNRTFILMSSSTLKSIWNSKSHLNIKLQIISLWNFVLKRHYCNSDIFEYLYGCHNGINARLVLRFFFLSFSRHILVCFVCGFSLSIMHCIVLYWILFIFGGKRETATFTDDCVGLFIAT